MSFLAIAAFLFWSVLGYQEGENDDSKIIKIALREVGNQLLLSNHDSTSLISPILEIEELKFELGFEKELSFEPNILVLTVKSVFQRSALPECYIVEVIQDKGGEVAYSYQMTESEQTTIIPCVSRTLPIDRYSIQVTFGNPETVLLSKETISYFCAFSFLVLSGVYFSKRTKAEDTIIRNTKRVKENQGLPIGQYLFSAEQSTLLHNEEVIHLSRKECELLSIFVEKLNQVVTRDELTKRVWEDNGVIVSRSLDTYISKLRTKLKSDKHLKITNVHGLGYKLELIESVS